MHTKHLQLIVISLIFGCVLGMWTGNTSWAQTSETPAETPTVAPPEESPTATPLAPVETATATPQPPAPTNTPVVQPESPTNTPVPPVATSTPVVVPESPTNTPVAVEPVRLSVEGGSVQVGDMIDVNIIIQNAVDIDAFSFIVASSAGQLEAGSLSFVEVDNAGTLTADFFTVQASEVPVVGALQVRVAGIGGDASVNGDGVLLKIRYEGAGPGDVTVDLIELIDDLAGAEVTSGIIAVSGVVGPTETPTSTPVVPTAVPTQPETATATPVVPTVVPTQPETVTATPAVPTPVPTNTPVPVATNTPVVAPTESGTATPVVATRTPVVSTRTPGATVPIPVYTPTKPPTATPVPATPTKFIINPDLGLVSYDKLGGSYARGAAIHNFDIGLSVLDPRDPFYGRLFAQGIFDGLPDPDAYGPFMAFEIVDEAQGFTLNFIPIAKDMEFTGEILPSDQGGTGTEGIFFLIGGNIGPLPPVNARLGAGIQRPDPDTGNEAFGGGIDVDNDPSNNIDFGSYRGDIVSVGYDPSAGDSPEAFDSPLVDVEPAGNAGFYVLSRDGRIYAEGAANEALDTQLTLPVGVSAVNLEIYKGEVSAANEYTWALDLSDSKYSSNLTGVAAYVLDSAGAIHRIPETAPEPNMENVPAGAEAFGYKDIEFVPSPAGDRMIGLAVLTGDGMIHFAPFPGEDTAENEAFVTSIAPFGQLTAGFPFDIARDFEVEIRGADTPFVGIAADGTSVEIIDTRVGIYMSDGYGGLHIGGSSTRFASAPLPGGAWVVDGVPSIPVEVALPYYLNSDFVVDLELTWPLNPAHVNE